MLILAETSGASRKNEEHHGQNALVQARVTEKRRKVNVKKNCSKQRVNRNGKTQEENYWSTNVEYLDRLYIKTIILSEFTPS